MHKTLLRLSNTRDLLVQHEKLLSTKQKKEIDLMLVSTYWAVERKYMSKVDYEVNKLCDHVNKLLFGE